MREQAMGEAAIKELSEMLDRDVKLERIFKFLGGIDQFIDWAAEYGVDVRGFLSRKKVTREATA